MADLVAAAVIASIVLALAPGLGVVAWFGLPLLLVGIIWILVERSLARRRARRVRRSG